WHPQEEKPSVPFHVCGEPKGSEVGVLIPCGPGKKGARKNGVLTVSWSLCEKVTETSVRLVGRFQKPFRTDSKAQLRVCAGRVSSSTSDFYGAWNSQAGLVDPAAGIGRTMPALQGDGTNVVAFLIIQDFAERGRKAVPHLLRGAADEKEALATVV